MCLCLLNDVWPPVLKMAVQLAAVGQPREKVPVPTGAIFCKHYISLFTENTVKLNPTAPLLWYHKDTNVLPLKGGRPRSYPLKYLAIVIPFSKKVQHI